MRVQFSVVDESDHPVDVYVDLDVIPREDEQVQLRTVERELTVRAVVHYPQGTDATDTAPSVYIALGNPR